MSDSSATSTSEEITTGPALVQCIIVQQGVDIFKERSVHVSGNRFRVNMRPIRANEKALDAGRMTVGEYPFDVHGYTEHLALVTPRSWKESMNNSRVAVPQRYVFPENHKEQASQSRTEDVESELVQKLARGAKKKRNDVEKHDDVEEEGFGIPEEIPPGTFITHLVNVSEFSMPFRKQVIRLALIAGDNPNKYMNEVNGDSVKESEIKAVKDALISSFFTQIDPLARSMFEITGEGDDRQVAIDLSKV